MASTDSLRLGIIGCGALGAIHAERLSAIPGVTVVGLSDPSPEARGRARAVLPNAPEVVAEHHSALMDAGLDAVCIASPDAFHVDQILDALQAGLHVLCEKPLTPYENSLDAVLAARDRSGKIVALTYPRRYDGGHRAVRREIQSGRWGKVTSICVYNAEDWITPNQGTWRHDTGICPGGFFYDASGHQLDLVLWATGLYARSVRAWKHQAGTPVPIRVWGHAWLSDDVPLTFHFVGDAHAWREQVAIHCERMDFVMENFRAKWSRDGRPVPIEPAEEGLGPDLEFVKMIREGHTNASPPDDVRPVLRLTEAALLSAERDEPVDVRH